MQLRTAGITCSRDSSTAWSSVRRDIPGRRARTARYTSLPPSVRGHPVAATTSSTFPGDFPEGAASPCRRCQCARALARSIFSAAGGLLGLVAGALLIGAPIYLASIDDEPDRRRRPRRRPPPPPPAAIAAAPPTPPWSRWSPWS